MKYGPVQLPAHFGGDTDFRNWVSGIRTALLAVGLVRTSDTGQIDPTTVARPVANTPAGYDIWRLNDAEQSSSPMFLKLEYGSGSVIDRPAFWHQMGGGSNGAGVLTGIVTTRTQILPAASRIAGETLPVYAAGDGHGVVLISNIDPAASGYTLAFIIDRPRLANGNPTTEAFFYWMFGANATARWGYVPPTGVAYFNNNSAQQPLMPPIGQSRIGLEATLWPHLMSVGARARLGKMAFSYISADINPLVPVAMSDFMGEDRTIMPIGFSIASTSITFGSYSSAALAILWED